MKQLAPAPGKKFFLVCVCAGDYWRTSDDQHGVKHALLLVVALVLNFVGIVVGTSSGGSPEFCGDPSPNTQLAPCTFIRKMAAKMIILMAHGRCLTELL